MMANKHANIQTIFKMVNLKLSNLFLNLFYLLHNIFGYVGIAVSDGDYLDN